MTDIETEAGWRQRQFSVRQRQIRRKRQFSDGDKDGQGQRQSSDGDKVRDIDRDSSVTEIKSETEADTETGWGQRGQSASSAGCDAACGKHGGV